MSLKKMYSETKTFYQKLRRRLKGSNDLIGRTFGLKAKRVPFSRPATLAAAQKFGAKELRVIEIGCAAGNNALDILRSVNGVPRLGDPV